MLGAGVAAAHPEIVGSIPLPGAEVATAPARVVIVFAEPVEALSTLALYDSAGATVAEGGAPDPASPERLVLTPGPLGPGVYTVVWTAAGADGHVVRGDFTFTVLGGEATPGVATTAAPAPAATTATPAPAATPTPVLQPEPPFPTAQSLTRWALLLGTTGAVGGWAFWPLVALPALGGGVAPARAVRRWRAWVVGLLTTALLAAPLLLAIYAAEISGRGGLDLLWGSLRSRQGLLMLARVGLVAGLLALTATARDGTAIRRRAPAALGLGALLFLAGAVAGHAGASAAPLVPVALTWLHLAATSIWGGGLLLFALALRPLLHTRPMGERPAMLAAMMARFTPLAFGSVAALTISGAAAALRELPDLPALWLTPYGQALSVKLLLFGAMLALGAFHLLVARRGLRAAQGLTLGASPARWLVRSGRSLWAEGGAAILVLGAAGALTSLAPPVGPTPYPLAAATPTIISVPTVTPGPTRTPVPSVPFDQTRPAGDLLVRLEIAPASLGENRFRVTVTDRGGQPVATQTVQLSFIMRAMEMDTQVLEASEAAGAALTVTGSPLNMVGDWEISVMVRRAGAADATATFTVPVGE